MITKKGPLIVRLKWCSFASQFEHLKSSSWCGFCEISWNENVDRKPHKDTRPELFIYNTRIGMQG